MTHANVVDCQAQENFEVALAAELADAQFHVKVAAKTQMKSVLSAAHKLLSGSEHSDKLPLT